MMPGRRLLVAVIAIAVLVAVGTAVNVARARPTPSAAQGWRVGAPFVRGKQTVATYSYAAAVRESVLVNAARDSDGDGHPDQIAVDVIRPGEAATSGFKVPVIMDASPYYKSVGRGSELQTKKYDATGAISSFPLFLDNYFVPRGYAVVLVDLSGTNRSTGCMDVGGPAEVASAVAVIDWLNGRTTATYRDGRPAVSTWSTGKVGMIGKSYDGSIANGVAATGVSGLATIVPESAISSWHDMIVRYGVLAPGDDPLYLEDDLNGRPPGVCDGVRGAQRAAAGSGGDYNEFWAQRNYRDAATRVRASVLAVQGLADQTVLPSNVALWWSALGAAHVPRKLWLSREAHVDPFDFRRTTWIDTLHRWFDYWLQGIPNGIMTEPAVSIERAPGRWIDEKSWPAASGSTPLPLGDGDRVTGTLGDNGTATRTFRDEPDLGEAYAVIEPNQARSGRLVFLSGALSAETRISGIPSVTLRTRISKPTTELTARLVDYGSASRVDPGTAGQGVHKTGTSSCWGDSVAADSACYPDFTEDVATKDLSIVTRGWCDAAHHTSPRQATPLAPNQWYSITVPLQATDAVIPAGHVLGLIVTGTDPSPNIPVSTGARIDVDLSGSHLDLPVAGTMGLPHPVGTPPTVTGRDAPTTAPARTLSTASQPPRNGPS